MTLGCGPRDCASRRHALVVGMGMKTNKRCHVVKVAADSYLQGASIVPQGGILVLSLRFTVSIA